MALTEKAERVVRDPRWQSLLEHDREADGKFFYSVATTGVYCRPSCGARTPRPENVAFYGSAAEAERAGFRACKRCRPGGASPRAELTGKIAEACRCIEKAETRPSLEELAAKAGMSRFHFHRAFKAVTGVTPVEYASTHRTARVRAALIASRTVTEAIYDAGYQSSGRFYEGAGQTLGMTPSAFRAGGTGARIWFAVRACSLGRVLVAQTARGICAILLGDDAGQLERDLRQNFPKATLVGDAVEYRKLVAQVVALVDDPRLGLELPLDIQGTAFQKRVWNELRRIPPGTTASYSEIARKVGKPKAVRAVARACAANALAVAVPCHRVVRSDGALSGYRWGAERKQALQERERRP